MSEARRFLRYVIPGLSFGVQLALLLWLLVPNLTREALLELGRSNASLGIALVAFLGSGGVGFLLSVIHHRVHRRQKTMDHQDFIRQLRNRNLLKLVNRKNGEDIPKSEEANREEAWFLVTALWYERLETSNKIRGAHDRANSLADLTHSIGTARIGSVAAFVLMFPIAISAGARFEWGWDPSFTLTVVVAGLLFWLHEVSYRRTAQAAIWVVEEVLFDVIAREGHNVPVSTYVNPKPPEEGLLSRARKSVRQFFCGSQTGLTASQDRPGDQPPVS